MREEEVRVLRGHEGTISRTKRSPMPQAPLAGATGFHKVSPIIETVANFVRGSALADREEVRAHESLPVLGSDNSVNACSNSTPLCL